MQLYRNSKLEKEELRKKIFPVRLESLQLKNPAILRQYIQHWQKIKNDWEEFAIQNASAISPKQHEQYDNKKHIAGDIGKILHFLADINSVTAEQLEKNDFDELKKAIKKNMG